MKEQKYTNHGRYVFVWHVLTGLAVIALLIGSIVNLIHFANDNFYSASLLVLVSLILCSIFWYARAFALKVQDRAIRAEENFRHFILTGKPLNGRLKMQQIIALRFAEDEELPDLAKKAAEEGMSNKGIKLAIKKWRADHYRA